MKITWRTGLDMSWWAARVKWEGRRNICEVACAPDESWVRCKNFIFWNLPGGFVSAVPASSSAPGERGRNDFKTQLIFLSGPVLCMNRLVLKNNMNTCWQKYQIYLGFNQNLVFTWSTRGRVERESECGAGPILKLSEAQSEDFYSSKSKFYLQLCLPSDFQIVTVK